MGAVLKEALNVAADASYTKQRELYDRVKQELENELGEHLFGMRLYTFGKPSKDVSLTNEQRQQLNNATRGILRSIDEYGDARGQHARFTTAYELDASRSAS